MRRFIIASILVSAIFGGVTPSAFAQTAGDIISVYVHVWHEDADTPNDKSDDTELLANFVDVSAPATLASISPDGTWYLYNVVNPGYPASALVTFTLSPDLDDKSVHRWEFQDSSSAVANTIGFNRQLSLEIQSAGGGANTKHLHVFLGNSAGRDPVNCAIFPDANTVTGATRLWGQQDLSEWLRIDDPTSDLYPVRGYSGEFEHRIIDFIVKGIGLDFVWSRAYRSKKTVSGVIGSGWDFSYNISIRHSGDLNPKRVRLGNGHEIIFEYLHTDTTIGSEADVYYAKGWSAELRDRPSDTTLVIFGDGTVWDFQDAPNIDNTDVIHFITDRHGNRLEFIWEPEPDHGANPWFDRLASITDTRGHVYNVSYMNGNLVGLQEVDGPARTITYDYYAGFEPGGNNSDLKSVTYPAISSSPARTTSYTYETNQGSEDKGNLLTITDARGNTVLTNIYDGADRIARQIKGTDPLSTATIDYDFPDTPSGLIGSETKKAIINDGEGHVSELFYDDDHRLLRYVAFTGLANATQPTTDLLNRPSGAVRAGDPPSYTTKFDWNVDDQLLSQTDPDNSKIEFVYFTDSDVLFDPGNPTLRRRIANVKQIKRVGSGGPTITEDLTHKIWLSEPNEFAGCRCGEQFIETRKVTNEAAGLDFDVKFFYNETTGDHEGTSHGALPGFPVTVHESFTYNAEGQLETHTHPKGYDDATQRVDTFQYFADVMLGGYLKSSSVGSLTTNFTVDNVGRVLSVVTPNGGDSSTKMLYNSNDEISQLESPHRPGAHAKTRYEYDENGNIERAVADNLRSDGSPDPANADLVTAINYDSLNFPLLIAREVDNSESVTTEYRYDRNHNLIEEKSSLAAAGIEPANKTKIEYDERDLVYRLTRAPGDPSEIIAQIDYTPVGNVAAQVVGVGAPGQRTTSIEYDAFNRVFRHTDPVGTKTEILYNGLDQPTAVEVIEGATTLSKTEQLYDVSGRNHTIKVTAKDETGVNLGDGFHTTVFDLAENGQVKTTTVEGEITSFIYDAVNRLQKMTDPKTNTVEYVYDANSNVKEVKETHIDDSGGPPQVFVTKFDYDPADRPIKEMSEYAAGASNDTTVEYDSRGNVVRVTDARGKVMSAVYDGLNRPLSVTRGVGVENITTTSTYDANSRLKSRSDPKTNITTYFYNPRDQRTSIVYADGTKDTFIRDLFGNVDERTDPRGVHYDNVHDALDRLTSRTITDTDGLTLTETTGYDGLSRVISKASTGATVSSMTRVYDTLGSVLSETMQLGAGPVRTVSHTTDDRGRRTGTTYPGTGSRNLSFGHDANDQVTSITDSGSNVATNQYAGPKLVTRSYGNDTKLTNTYNGHGTNVGGDVGVGRIARTEHVNTLTSDVIDERTNEWDGSNNKTQYVELWPTTLNPPQAAMTHGASYDGFNRMTQSTVDGVPTDYNLGAAGSREGAGYAMDPVGYAPTNQYSQTPFELARYYDRSGNHTEFVIAPGVSKAYTWDARDRLISLVTREHATASTSVNLDDLNGWEATPTGTWNMSGGVLEETSAAPVEQGRILRAIPDQIEKFKFSYKSAHDPEDPDLLAETADDGPKHYALGLIRVDGPDGSGDWRYAALVVEPNNLFLREWSIVTSAEDVTELFALPFVSEKDVWYDVEIVYNGSDVTIRHAKEGDPLVDLTTVSLALAPAVGQQLGFGVGEAGEYQFKDITLINPTSTAEQVEVAFEYDAFGRRTAKTVDPGGTADRTEFVYDGARVIEERDSLGNVDATYVWGNYVDEILQMQRGGQTYYFHQDDQYNVVAVTDGAGAVVERYRYGDYGEPTVMDAAGTPIAESAIGNPYLFHGRRYDPETGLYYYRTRYLDPRAGRFLSRDTIGQYGDPANLGNGLAFVGNNPWSRLDPFGQLDFGIFKRQIAENLLTVKQIGSDIGRAAVAYARDTPSALVHFETAPAQFYQQNINELGTAEGISVSTQFLLLEGLAGIEDALDTGVALAKGDLPSTEVDEITTRFAANATFDATTFGLFTRLKLLKPRIGPNPADLAPSPDIPRSLGAAPNRIYSARELVRRAEEPGPFHNFPESLNDSIFKGDRKAISDNFVLYTQRGSINGRSGTFEIGVRPSASGRTEVITHRFFRPDRKE